MNGSDVGAHPLVEVRHLTVEFVVSATDWGWRRQKLRALDDVSLDIQAGETVGIVGESGCGKSTLSRAMVGILRPTRGVVSFDGLSLGAHGSADRRRFRRRVQMVFQDPYAALNPRMKVGDTIAEPLRAQRIGSRDSQQARVRELLGLVGLPANAANRFPDAFSGGQRQRIGIARALAVQPDLLVADEPVSALDVSVQAQIINLLADLRAQLGLTLVFVAHDLAVIRQIATRVVVMYLGAIVETGPVDEVFTSAQHPYTQALLSAVPNPDPDVELGRTRVVLTGEIPSPLHLPSGCRFHTRCPYAMPVCSTIEPVLSSSGASRQVACHLIHPPIESIEASG